MKSLSIMSLALVMVFALAINASAQSDKGKEKSQERKSRVSTVVEELKEIAGKDQNIGEEVMLVAQEQNESNERATAAMEKVESRGKFKTLLFGTDYKNVGALRSELVTTQNHISRLTKASERTEDVEVQAELDTQIQALQETNSATESFIQENEGKFSLLGWLVRLFN